MASYSGITISELEILTNVADDDFIIINDTSQEKTKKIAVSNLLSSVPENLLDSSTGIRISGDLRVNGDLEVENEIVAGGDISTSGNITFGSLTDYANNITILCLGDSAGAIVNTDSCLATAGAIKSYLNQNNVYSRQEFQVTTATSFGINDSEQIDISAYKSYMLLKVATDSAALVRVYCNETSRNADIGRSYGTLASDSSGLMAEVNTTGNKTITLSPGIVGYNNSTPISGIVPITVIKRTAGVATSGITVTLTLLKLED